MYTYKNDPVNASQLWDYFGGMDKLTQDGMLQERQLGFSLREKYFNVTEHYKSREVYAYSMDSDLNLSSMYSLLSSLFEPSGYQIFDKNLEWQPVPVYTTNLAKQKVHKTKNLFFFKFKTKVNVLISSCFTKIHANVLII